MGTSLIPVLLSLWAMMLPQQSTPVRLDVTEYWVTDSTKYASFHLKVINDNDSATFIESVDPSCGCVMASVQRNKSTRERPGDIYIAVATAQVDTLQPITVDVYTQAAPKAPLRLFIRKQSLHQ